MKLFLYQYQRGYLWGGCVIRARSAEDALNVLRSSKQGQNISDTVGDFAKATLQELSTDGPAEVVDAWEV